LGLAVGYGCGYMISEEKTNSNKRSNDEKQ
jgi:hypothetical protein